MSDDAGGGTNYDGGKARRMAAWRTMMKGITCACQFQKKRKHVHAGGQRSRVGDGQTGQAGRWAMFRSETVHVGASGNAPYRVLLQEKFMWSSFGKLKNLFLSLRI